MESSTSFSTFNNWKNHFWHGYADHLAERFGEKVYKITVSAGFTCPTRDGTRGSEGCAFCDERGSSSFFASGSAGLAIREQLVTTMPRVQERFQARKFLAYFQSFTNTYAPTAYLREVYDAAINVENVIGMAIGTRPDCIPNDVLALLNSYGRGGRYISLELGLQSIRDEALKFYARGHDAAEGVDGIRRAMQFPNLSVCVHLMFGAPGDTVQTAIESAMLMNRLGVHGVKVHQLMVLKETMLATRYQISPWPFLSLDEYNEMVMAFLEHLDPRIYVERTHALSSHPDELVGPQWSAGRFAPMNHLRHLMAANGSYQGKKITRS